jgi:CubicO group peptidase (beta-lactamase class C family)
MKRYFYLLTLCVLSTATLRAQQLDSIRYVIDSTFTRSPFYGNILITEHGKTLFEQSYGYADAQKKTKLTSDHSFQIASVSKQFTAYGIMILHQDHKIEYDSSVNKYLPGFPYTNITIRHLLTHTSGLPNFWDSIRTRLDTMHSYGNKEVLDYLIQHRLPLQFEPGSQFDYCDIGYDFLATIIERLSGQSYTDYLNTKVFKPLGMKHTIAYKVTDIRRIHNKNLAVGHQQTNGAYQYAHLLPENGFVFYLGDFYGDGSIVSSARDLAIWDKALKQCTLLPCEVQQEAMMPYKMNNGSTDIGYGRGYGFGWFIRQNASGTLVYHTGHHPGNVLAIYRLTDSDRCLILLSNTDTGTVRELRARILYFLQQ